MDVQLGRDIAQGPDIQLFHRAPRGRAQGPDGAAGRQDLLHEGGKRLWRQVFQLTQTGLAGQEHDPGIAGVVLQPGGA